jgi:microcystin degradation protein MlrC
MRLALLGFYHETNTFSVTPTTYALFARDGLLHGAEIVARYADAGSSVTGFLDAGQEPGVEVVPLFFTTTGPSGTITADAFERIADELVTALRQHAPWDGVLLVLHGAAVAEGFPDADGEMAARVRAAVGPDVPIGVAMDLHGNNTQRLIDNTTAVVFYRTNPHLDARVRARECAEIIIRTVRGEIHPVQAMETPPLVINIVKQFTGAEPLRSLMAACEELIARPGILSASVVQGYPYADVPEMGMSFIVVADGDAALARDSARELARAAWARRDDFLLDAPSPEVALRRAMDAPAGPVVLMDVGDNVGAGSAGDSTVLLAAARRLGVRPFLQTLYDPEAVGACIEAGVGRTITVAVGGKTDRLHGEPVTVTGRVRLIAEGHYEEPRPTHGGFRFYDDGVRAVLETTEGQTLVFTSHRAGNTSIEQLYSLGIRPEAYRVVVAKGVQSPRPAYEPIAAEIILVNTPGAAAADLGTFEYHQRRRPLYPFEPDATYE